MGLQVYPGISRLHTDKCLNLLRLPPLPKRSKLETHTLAVRMIAREEDMAGTPRAAMPRQGADTKQRRYVQVCHIVIVDVEGSVSNSVG